MNLLETQNEEYYKLDEDLLDVPNNSPIHENAYIRKHSFRLDNYILKQIQIKNIITELKESNRLKNKIKIEINALERHLNKLIMAEKSGEKYEDFRDRIIESYKTNKNVNQILRTLYD